MAKPYKVPGTIFEPVWLLPCVLSKYRRRGGKRSRWHYTTGDPMLEVAIESGLVQMIEHEPNEPLTCGWLERVDKKKKIPRITDEMIEAQIIRGLLKSLEKEQQKEPKAP